MTRTSLAALALGLSGALSACGGGSGSGAPTDATQEEFCGVHSGSWSFLTHRDPDGSAVWSEELTETFDERADQLERVGTPSDISDEARSGYDDLVERLRSAGPDLLDGSLEETGADRAFAAYVEETCGSSLDQLPEVPQLPGAE